MEALKGKIARASESTNARFKRKKIRSMKREADKINEKLKESEAKLAQVPTTYHHHHPPARNKHIEKKIAEINKKIKKVKNSKNEKFIIAKREALNIGRSIIIQGNIKMGVNRLNAVQKATYFLKK